MWTDEAHGCSISKASARLSQVLLTTVTKEPQQEVSLWREGIHRISTVAYASMVKHTCVRRAWANWTITFSNVSQKTLQPRNIMWQKFRIPGRSFELPIKQPHGCYSVHSQCLSWCVFYMCECFHLCDCLHLFLHVWLFAPVWLFTPVFTCVTNYTSLIVYTCSYISDCLHLCLHVQPIEWQLHFESWAVISWSRCATHTGT